mgnify:CR=1 FL=1
MSQFQKFMARLDAPAPDWLAGLATLACIIVLLAWWCV